MGFMTVNKHIWEVDKKNDYIQSYMLDIWPQICWLFNR